MQNPSSSYQSSVLVLLACFKVETEPRHVHDYKMPVIVCSIVAMLGARACVHNSIFTDFIYVEMCLAIKLLTATEMFKHHHHHSGSAMQKGMHKIIIHTDQGRWETT